MFRKIHKLQAEIDEMLDLCAEAGLEHKPIGAKAIKRQRLYVMILKMQDGNLHPRYIHRLEKWLACDRQAVADYVEFQHLTVMLHEHFNPGRFSKFVNFIKSCMVSHV